VAQLVWREAGQRITDYFDSVSIEKMCAMAKELGIEKQLDHRFMYFI
jgi:DNA-binding IscR family transcriptional regulator